MGLIQDHDSVAELERIVRNDSNYFCQSAAALSLGLLGAEEASDALISLLDSRNGVCRATAATTLGWLGCEKAAPHLIRLLDPNVEDDGTTRGSAATALGQVGDPKAVDALRRFVDDEPDPIVYFSILGAIRRIEARHQQREFSRPDGPPTGFRTGSEAVRPGTDATVPTRQETRHVQETRLPLLSPQRLDRGRPPARRPRRRR